MVYNIMDAWERSAKRGPSQADGAVEDPAQDVGMGDTGRAMRYDELDRQYKDLQFLAVQAHKPIKIGTEARRQTASARR